MVAQVMAIRHPSRVVSLASLMATTGQRGKGRTSPRILRRALTRRPRTPEKTIERRVRLFEAFGSPGLGQDFAEIRRVLRAGGRLQLGDIVLDKERSDDIRSNIDLWAG